MSGKVYLVGAGPGDPELLTMKAARILRSADVVLHDALVSEAILQMVRPHAYLINVGKRMGTKAITQDEIGRRLIEAAGWANTIVRLKGGDPLVFGRAAEEIDALRAANVEFEIVPGITAAVAAASQAQIPLTDRKSSSAVIFLTAQQAIDKEPASVARFAAEDATLAIYMPAGQYRSIANSLVNAGLAATTPCLVASNASRENQEYLWTDLGRLETLAPAEAPALLIVGKVARRRDREETLSMLASTPHVDDSRLET